MALTGQTGWRAGQSARRCWVRRGPPSFSLPSVLEPSLGGKLVSIPAPWWSRDGLTYPRGGRAAAPERRPRGTRPARGVGLLKAACGPPPPAHALSASHPTAAVIKPLFSDSLFSPLRIVLSPYYFYFYVFNTHSDLAVHALRCRCPRAAFHGGPSASGSSVLRLQGASLGWSQGSGA